MFCFALGFYLWSLRGAAPKFIKLQQKINWGRCGNKHQDCCRAPESQSLTPCYKAETSTKSNEDLNNLEAGRGSKHDIPHSGWGQLRGVWVLGRIKSSRSPTRPCVSGTSGTRVCGAASSSSYHEGAPAEMLSALLHLNSVTCLLRVPT